MGAILVLFLYTLMLMNLNKSTEPMKSTLVKVAAVIGGGCLMVTIIASIKALGISQPVVLKNPDIGLVQNLGKVLFNEFLLPFEISSLLLLSAMVGAVLLATKEPKSA
jgi:NADH-quinone oxidoreductase subunit J